MAIEYCLLEFPQFYPQLLIFIVFFIKNFQKINVVDRLSLHLEKGTPISAVSSYLQQIES